MTAVEGLAAVTLLVGGGFYLAGTVGLLRFPDALSRLHALTKADNVGLLLVCVGLGLLSGSWREAALLLLIWLLALLASTVSAHLIARRALADGIDVVRRDGGTP
jgi:multicomponent Na+:H+ antiporter subunit G